MTTVGNSPGDLLIVNCIASLVPGYLIFPLFNVITSWHDVLTTL